MGASSSPVVFHSAAILVNVLDGRIRNFVLLAGRKSRSRDFDNTQVWTLFSQKVRVQFATHVRNVVAGVALNHFLCVLRIGNKVVEDLIIRQIHQVRLHAVNLHITIRRTDRNTDRRSLCKVVACIVQLNAAGDTIQPQNHFPILTIWQNIELELHEIIFTGRQFNRVLLTGQCDFLCLNIQANTAIQTGQCRSIVVLDVCSLKHKLEILAQLFRIVAKELIADSCGCACFNTEVGIAIFVQLITAIRPVKIIADSQTVIAIRPQSSFVCVRLARRVEIKCQIRLDRLNGNTKLLDGDVDCLAHRTTHNF